LSVGQPGHLLQTRLAEHLAELQALTFEVSAVRLAAFDEDQRFAVEDPAQRQARTPDWA